MIESTAAPLPKTAASSSEFKRVLTLSDLVLFGLAFIGPTAPYSMFGLATVKSQGHLPLVYLLAMIAMSFTAISYGRLATTWPEAGSTYTYVTKALHPTVGYFAGWAMILDYLLIPLLSVIFVALTANKVWPEAPYSIWVMIAAVGITAINLGGIRMTARAHWLMNAMMFVSLVWFIALAIRALWRGTGEASLFSTKPFFNPQTFSVGAITSATSLAVLSFLGFDGVTTLAEDAKNPRRDIGRATLLVCFIAGGLFVLESYLAQMVWPDYKNFVPIETAFMDIGKLIGGASLFYFLSFVLVVAGVASAVTGQASAARLLCGRERDRLLPYRLFGYVHPRWGTPVYSVLLMGAVLGAVWLQYSEAAELVNFGAFIGFIFVNVCVMRLGLQARQSVVSLILPLLGGVTCFCIWLHLSGFALRLGAAWLVLGLVYLALLTRGFKTRIATLKLEAESESG
jgi:amino acid transporter